MTAASDVGAHDAAGETAVAEAEGMVAAADEPAEVVITGSHLARTGYDAPTPVTVIGEEDLMAAGQPNIADFVNDLPAVAGSQTPANSNRSLSNGAAGVNSINLRSLGSARTLVLLDGRRSVGSLAQGTVDINTFPQGLVKRIEIVTGGASATYGSDAVSGVVNFILDKTFTGIKTTLEADGPRTATTKAFWPVSPAACRLRTDADTSCSTSRAPGATASTVCPATGPKKAGTW